MKWPNTIAAGSKSGIPITSVDFLPTFATLAAVPLPAGQPVDGRNLLPILEGENVLSDRAIFWHQPLYSSDKKNENGPASAIRKGDWKFIEFFDDGIFELYNLASDIGESKNLAFAEPAKARAMYRELIQWRQAVNAPVPADPNPYYRGNSSTDIKQIGIRFSQIETQIEMLQDTVQTMQNTGTQLKRLIDQLRELEKQERALEAAADGLHDSALRIVRLQAAN